MNNPILYAKANPFQTRDAESVLKSYKGRLNHYEDTDNILDIGCGSGNVTRNILAPFCGRYRNIVAVDISSDMIEFARQTDSSDDIFYDVLDISADVRNFRSEWGGFAKVFSFYCLHWVKDLSKAVRNIHQLMIYGGECLLVFVAQCPVFEMYQKLAKCSKWSMFMEDVNNFVPITQHNAQPAFLFSQLMLESGFAVEKCEVVDKEFLFPSPTMLRDCMCAVNPFLSRIPDDLKSEFITNCLQILAAMKVADTNHVSNLNTNKNEGHCFSYKLLIAQAKKV